MTDLSIIIVNYKSAHLILDCLESLYTHTASLEFEVIVVDNHSGDESQRLILTRFPEVRWIEMGYNAGFARANNQGIRDSKGRAVLLLNPDTLIQTTAISDCYHQLMQSDYLGAGVQLVNADGSPQISGNFRMTGGLNILLPLPYLGNFLKALGEGFNVKKPNIPDSSTAVEVDWINGAFLMIRREAIDRAGLLDEDFFLFSEEAEWCGRIRKSGKLCLFGALRVIHLQGETANKTFASEGKGYYNLFNRKGLQIMVSNFVRIRKEFGRGWFLVNLFLYTIEVPVFLIGLLPGRLLGGKNKSYTFNDFRVYCSNLAAVWRLGPRILSNKPYFYKML